MIITGAGKIAGIMGWPVAQSMSPVLYGYWLEEYGVDGAMVPLKVAPEDFTTVLTGIRRAGFRGVNVTVPHKQAAFALAHFCDQPAQAAAAANLLVFHDDGRIEGCNTDAPGLSQSLKEGLGETLRGKDAVLLGTGGAARGAILALADRGVSSIHVLGRNAVHAKALCDALAPAVACKLIGGDFAAWDKAAGNAALLLNATSAGLNGQNLLTLSLDPLPKTAAVCDIVYKPLETDLLKRARARGHLCLDGLGMFMHQAAPSFEAFFGVRPLVTKGARAVLERVLAGG